MQSVCTCEREVQQGFATYVLRSSQVEIAIVPELGARIIRLCHCPTNHEWLWSPSPERRLFRNRVGDDFTRSPLVGIDECLPTIGPCVIEGQRLADHGEAWQRAWEVDAAAWERGVLVTRLNLTSLPLQFSRELVVDGACVAIRYRLHNRGRVKVPCLWALHPLFRWEPGDRIELSPDVRVVRVETTKGPDAFRGQVWPWPSPVPEVTLDRAEFGASRDGSYAKVFAGPETGGLATLRSVRNGVALSVRWNIRENPWLGVWITRGGWSGHHHVALEPTNVPGDELAAAVSDNVVPFIAPGETRTWKVEIVLSGAEGV